MRASSQLRPTVFPAPREVQRRPLTRCPSLWMLLRRRPRGTKQVGAPQSLGKEENTKWDKHGRKGRKEGRICKSNENRRKRKEEYVKEMKIEEKMEGESAEKGRIFKKGRIYEGKEHRSKERKNTRREENYTKEMNTKEKRGRIYEGNK